MKNIVTICLLATAIAFASCGNGNHETSIDSTYNPGDTNNLNTNRNSIGRNGDQTNSMDTIRRDSMGRKDSIQ